MRLLNRQRVVHLLLTEGPLARADLAAKLGLARSSITAITGELIDDGTLIELTSRVEEPGTRGRPRVLLGPNPGARRVVGIGIDERRARIVIADATGTVVSEEATPTAGRSAAVVIRSINRIAKKLIDAAPGGPVTAAGVCIPGFVDSPTGVVIESNALGWSKVELGRLISRALGIPVKVQDTTQAITVAEAIAGQARQARSAVVLDYSSRVGIGLIIDGRPYAGGTGVAGAIGHLPVFGSTADCVCGRVGCVDACMSLLAMQRVAPQTVGVAYDDIDVDAIAADTSRNPQSQNVIGEVIDRVAHTAVLIEGVLDPEVLVLAGFVIEFESLVDALETRIDQLRPPERRGRTRTVRSQIHRDAHLSILVALEQVDADIAGLLSGPLR